MARPRADDIRLRQRPRDGIWEIRFRDGAQTRSISTGTRDEEGARTYRDRFAAGRLGAPDDLPAATVGQILTLYLDDYRQRSGRETKWYGVALDDYLGRLRPSDLSDKLIREYVTARRQEGRSDGTIRRELAGTLRPALAFAVRQGWIEEAPHIPAPSEPPPRSDYLTREQWAEFRDACRQTIHLETYVMLALHTAARMGAILQLTWSQVKWDLERIDLGTGRGRKRRAVVPINAPLLEQLQRAWTLRTTDHVIEWRSKPVVSIKTAFDKAAKRAGLDWLHPHLLRHTAATWMAMDGVPMQEIAAFLGDDPKTVYQRYAKFSPDYLRGAANALV